MNNNQKLSYRKLDSEELKQGGNSRNSQLKCLEKMMY